MSSLLAFALLTSPVKVEWQAPSGCPDGGAFVSRVAEPSGDTAEFRVTVDVTARADGTWQAELTMTRDGLAAERRVIDGESCQAVADAAALIVELRKKGSEPAAPSDTFVEPPPVLPSTTGLPPGEPEATGPPPPQQPAVTAARTDAPQNDGAPGGTRSPGVWVGLSGGIAAGVLPGVGGAAAIEAGLEGAAWRVGLAGRLFPARTQDGAEVAVDGRFTLATAGALGCYVPRYGAWAFPVCGRVEVGALRGEGRNADQSRVVWPLWAGFSASASARWQVAERIAPFVSLEGTAAVLTPGYAVGGVEGPFFQAGRGGVRGWLGFEIRLKNGPQKR